METCAPLLPPHKRSLAAQRLNEVAARGAFQLPQCETCGSFSWPMHELCPRCLGDLSLNDAPRGATLIAKTAVLAPVAPYFRNSGVAWHAGLVALAAGPSALAFIHPEVTSGTPLTMTLLLDRAGQAVLYGAPEGKMPSDDPQWREMSSPPQA